MDPDLISSALCARSQEITMEEMLKDNKDETIPSDHHYEELRSLIAKVYKAEQACEDAMATKEKCVNEINLLKGMIDDEKLELARNLQREKEQLIQKKEALLSILSAENMTIADVRALKDRVKPSKEKISIVQRLTENCNKLKDQIAEYSK